MTLLPETIGNVREVDITNEMQSAYLDYAMSVIVSRALPDVRDGLKPVHRRILYAMYDMGLTGDKPYKKSARIVGEVLGKYHPHGDTAVYDAMVRMAQDFSLRYPLVDGQGNFGSVDGDNAAAMRYTEARLAAISDLVLADLDKETVEWTDNFDNTLKEPQILPSTLPNLLINGASGIAVGMSTNVPPHNLGEIVDALVYVLDNFTRVDEISVEELLKFVKGPDFPTGGIVFRYREDRRGLETTDVITQGYATGRARLIIQAKAHFEEMSRGRTRIIVTELPYQTNKTNLLERIAFLVRDGKIDGITDMRDESDRAGMRIVFELNRNADAKTVLADLFKYTPMQQTFGTSMLALVDGEPRTLSLKRMLQLFIEHRQEVIRRRSEFDLARARERAHIVEGLLRALDIMDEVIDTIRRSQRVDTARANLMRNFNFSEVQAQAILDMPLKRLAALERKRLQDEYDELLTRIAYLEDLLTNPAKILAVIREELLKIRAQYADARRTQIVDRIKGTLTATDLLPDQKVLVSVGANGDVRRQALANINKTNLRQSARDSAVALLTANTQDFLYVFDRKGSCNRVPIHELPQDETKHLAELTNYSRRDRIVAAVALPRLTVEDAAGYLFLVTRGGAVKRVALADFVAAAVNNPEVIRVDEKDELGWVFPTPGGQEVILVAAGGRSIRFGEEEVRSMGLAAGGVAGMKLGKGEKVVYAGVMDGMGELLTVTANGFTKRTPMSEYSSQGRNGSGIIAHKTDKRTGDLIDALVINAERRDLVVFITDKGIAKPVELSEIPSSGRSTLGQTLKSLARGDQIVAVKVVEGIPGFVGDETLAPPSIKANGKPSRAEAPTVKSHPPASPAKIEPLPKKRAAPTARPKTPRATTPKATVPLKKVEGVETPTHGRKTKVEEKVIADPKPATQRKGSAKPAPMPVEEDKAVPESKPATRRRKAVDAATPVAVEAHPIQPALIPEEAAAEGRDETTVKTAPKSRSSKGARPQNSKSKVERVSSVTKSQKKK
ncbi:MAG: DNA gyrase subunit A [Caldilineaceae bacterium]|nr:DNA gyrase subunit A [Caldilineaceae bacterium]